MHSKSPLFQESTVYKPFKYPWAVDFSVLSEKMHWVEQEINVSDDIDDWNRNTLTQHEKDFITQILRLFTQSDAQVGANYYNYFIPHIKNNEIRNMLGSFACREQIHQRSYSLLNDSLGLADGDYALFLEYKEMKDKIEYMQGADTASLSGLALALVRSVFSEGIMLFASFAMLLHFQKRGLMKGMGKVVEFSIKDESLHCEGLTKLFKTMCEEHPRIVTDEFKKAVYEMAKLVVKLEDKFIDLVYNKGEISGLNIDDLKSYIRYISGRRLIQLGFKNIFKVKENALPWIEYLIGATHTNFFEQTVSDYSVGGLTGNWEYETK